MIPALTTAGTEVPKNIQVGFRRCGVVRVCAGFLGESACCAETEEGWILGSEAGEQSFVEAS